MRILVTYVAVGRGGDAIQLLELVRALRARGHEVSLVGPQPLEPYIFNTAGARLRSFVRSLPWWARDAAEFGLAARAAWRAFRTGRAGPVDLVIHRPGVYDFAAARVARRLGAPLALYLDAHVESERAFRAESYWRALHRYGMRTLGRSAVAIATPSRAVADYYAGLGLPADKIVILRNGISERHVRIGLEITATHPPLRDGAQCTVGFVGSLSPWHGVDLLLEATRRVTVGAQARDNLRPAGRDVRLVIVGRGAEYDTLKAQAQALGLEGIVEWRGAMSHDDAVRAMGEFDIAVLPNTLPTGAPMKLAEYAATGRPIIAPDLPNIRDMFTDGTEIILVQPGDVGALAQAICQLADDPEGARRLGRAAQARVASCTWEAAVDQLLSRATGGATGALTPFSRPY